MKEAQKSLGIIGAITCAIIGYGATKETSGAVAGAFSGFVIGATIPVVLHATRQAIVAIIILLIAGVSIIRNLDVILPLIRGL